MWIMMNHSRWQYDLFFKYCSHHHHFWQGYGYWKKHCRTYLYSFISGEYLVEPMMGSYRSYFLHPHWCMIDRVTQRLLLKLIKPTFNHVISSKCLHIKGPSVIAKAIEMINQACKDNLFRHVIRIDIKAYYESINQKILYQNLCNQM